MVAFTALGLSLESRVKELMDVDGFRCPLVSEICIS